MITLATGLALVALSTVVVTMVDFLRTLHWPKIAVQRRLPRYEQNIRESVGFCGVQVGDHRAT